MGKETLRNLIKSPKEIMICHGSRLHFTTGLLGAIRFEALGRDDAAAPAQLGASLRGSIGGFARQGQAKAGGHGEWGLKSCRMERPPPKLAEPREVGDSSPSDPRISLGEGRIEKKSIQFCTMVKGSQILQWKHIMKYKSAVQIFLVILNLRWQI